MRSAEDDDDDSDPTTGATEGRPAWMTTLASHAAEWLKQLPSGLTSPPVDSSPLARFFAREVSIGHGLLKRIRTDLSDLIAICEGKIKQTNELRSLMSDLNKGSIPLHWMRFKTIRGLAVAQFISNLVARLAQLESIASKPDIRRGIWLGGLFQPEAYITATRQTVAHQKGSSLEQLVLDLDLEDVQGEESFIVEGQSALRRNVLV